MLGYIRYFTKLNKKETNVSGMKMKLSVAIAISKESKGLTF